MELATLRTKFENDMRVLKEENDKRVEKHLSKTEEERNLLLAEFEKEKNRLETRIQKLSAFVDNFMAGSDCQDKFVKVSKTFFPTFDYVRLKELKSEVESLRCVIEIKNQELRSLRLENEEMSR